VSASTVATANRIGQGILARVTEKDVPPVSSSWRRIDAWLAVHAPASLAQLNAPVTPEALAAAQRVVGMEFPADLVGSLRCHDGQDDGVWTPVLPVKPPLDAASIAGDWESWMRIANLYTDRFEAQHDEDSEPSWHPLWIPFASSESDTQMIDLRPGPGYGRLGMRYHDDSADFSGGWPSLAAYLHEVAQALYSGADLPWYERDGVRSDYPFLTGDRELYWADEEGDDLIPAPIGLG
jgi:cell wall assembly regulator SMI1